MGDSLISPFTFSKFGNVEEKSFVKGPTTRDVVISTNTITNGAVTIKLTDGMSSTSDGKNPTTIKPFAKESYLLGDKQELRCHPT